MVVDEEGFLSPQIDKSQCKSCNQCRDVCPILTDSPLSFKRIDNPQAYACWIQDEAIRRQSSSGGLFSAIAMSVLSERGIVFGAAFNETMHLRHIGVEDACDESLNEGRFSYTALSTEEYFHYWHLV